MSDFVQNIESKRFLQIVDELISQRKVKSDAAFCKAADFSAQSFSQIRKAKRDVTIELISKLVIIYNGNPVFIFTGNGELVLLKEVVPGSAAMTQSGLDDTLNALRTENEYRKKLLDQYFRQGELNINYTKVLEEQNKELLKELGRSVKKNNNP